MTKVYSHPDPRVLLVEHLQNVANRCKQVLLDKKIHLAEFDQAILADLAYIAGAVHDIGKSTANFQHYLFTKEVIGNKNHSLVSAFAAFLLTKIYLEQQANVEQELKELLPYLVFIAVKRHHGNLGDFETELSDITEEEKKLDKLVDGFYVNETKVILNAVLEPLNIQFPWADFIDLIKIDLIKNQRHITDRSGFSIEYIDNDAERLIGESIRNYYIFQLLYSTLLFSDKSDVILQKELNKLPEININAVVDYREENKWNNPKEKIDKLKNKAYQKGLENLEKVFEKGQHLYSVTLPTGVGKTVTSFALALAIKKKLNNPESRIVITIPFTSIIDQNYKVYEDILKATTSGEILKHHHLAEPKYNEDPEDTVRTENESQFLIETWQSQVVVTTFVQLLECMFSNDKSKLMKLPNLANSIIILDEVQNISYKLWKPIRAAFDFFGKQLNCYFILMSATQPLIFEPEVEIKELIPHYREYFDFFKRTKLINRTQEVISLDDFVDEVVDYAENQNHIQKDILIILNTIKSTSKCFENIVQRLEEQEDTDFYYLSTRITPYERKLIIDRIQKKEEGGKRLIIVSTQLIEAGVDISVHTVFRNIAPLDSIIQAAGRANRYWENEEVSEIYLYKIEEIIKDTNKIYGPHLIMKTENVLKDIVEVEEEKYLDLIETYFKEVKIQADNSRNDLIKKMEKLQFAQVGDFSYIPDRRTNSIFAILNDKAAKIWEKYTNLQKRKDLKPYERKQYFARFKADFYDYVVNAPIPYDEESIAWDEEPQHFFYVWNYQEDNNFYHYSELEDGSPDFKNNLGYIPKSSSSF